MRFAWGVIAAACLLTCVAACSSGSPAASPTTPAFFPPVSPAKVTAACPLLDAGEAERITGLGSTPGREQPAEQAGQNGFYVCTYDWGSLNVLAQPGDDAQLATTVRIANMGCKEPKVAVPTTADSAVYCNASDDKAFVVVVKRTHGETRIAKVILKRTKTDAYTELTKTLADRL